MKSLFLQWKQSTGVFVLLLTLCCMQASYSGTLTDQFAKAASGSVSAVAAAGAISLLADGPNGKHEFVQGAKAMAATALVTEALKLTVREKRPNSESLSSFPSGHTAEAFAMATVLADYHPKLAWIAYTQAAIVGWSRVHEKEHHWQDVVAGALIGHFIAKRFTSGNFGITPDGHVGYHTRW